MTSVENINNKVFNICTLKNKLFKDRIINELDDTKKLLEEYKNKEKSETNNHNIEEYEKRISFLSDVLSDVKKLEVQNIIKKQEQEIYDQLDTVIEDDNTENNLENNDKQTTEKSKNWSSLTIKQKTVKIHEYCVKNNIQKEKENEFIEALKNKSLNAKKIKYDKINALIIKINY